MRVVPLKSSLLDSASFDEVRNVIMLRFTNSKTLYEYSKPEDQPEYNMEVTFISLITAESAGQYFLRNVKGKLPFRKVETNGN